MSTINYTVTVASAKFLIDGAEAPKLTFRDGDTYVFDQADSSNAGHILQFSATSNNSGSSEYTTGVTKTGTAGQAGAKTTIVTSGSTTDTLYFYSSGGGTYGEEFSNSGFNTSTTYNFLKPIVGAETTAEKWGPMINHALDQIDQGIDAAITAQDLDFQGDSGGALSIDLDTETLDIAGGTGIDTTGSGNEVSVAIDSTVATLTGSQTFTGAKTFGTVDINGGTIDGATITSPLINTGVSGSAILDSDSMSFASTTTLATSQSIKAYVDAQVTAQDLDGATDSGTVAVDLDSQSLTVAGGSGIATSGSGQTITVSVSNDGIDSQHYVAGSIDNEHLADDAVGTDELANNVVINTSGAITTTGIATATTFVGNVTGTASGNDTAGTGVAMSIALG